MRLWFALMAAVALAIAAPALGKPLDPALKQQLLGLFDSYNKAIGAGKLPEAVALRSAETRASIQKETKTAQARRELLTMARMMVPDTVEVLHATLNAAGNQARIITVAAKVIREDLKMPDAPKVGSTMRNGLTLTFIKEGGQWKFGDQIFGADPASITVCKDERFEPAEAYDQSKTVSMGGPITRVDFRPDYTLVVVRVVDEENCAFLSSREELQKHGLDPANLVPYAIVEIEGNPHRSDKQKVLVDSVSVRPED